MEASIAMATRLRRDCHVGGDKRRERQAQLSADLIAQRVYVSPASNDET